MTAGTDLTFNMVANDKNVATTFDILADCFSEMSVVLHRSADRLRDARIEEEDVA